MKMKPQTSGSRGSRISAAVAIILCLGMLGFILYSSLVDADGVSTPQTDNIILTWPRNPLQNMEYEIFVDNRLKQPASGVSESILIDVPHGKHCFKFRKRDYYGNVSRFSDPVCVQTSDMMEIHLTFNGSYI